MKRTDITELFPEATKEQIDRIMNLNSADITAARSGVDKLKEDHQNEITRLTEEHAGKLKAETDKTAAIQKQLDDMKLAETVRLMREKVSQDSGVPVNLLTASTEEDCKAQAEAISKYAKGNSYPNVRDGGEPGGTPKTSTRDQFATWANEIL